MLLFMHPQNAPGTTENARWKGKGAFVGTVGNPLETTVFLSHLMFEGTFDRFPGLRICGARAGGYLASYSGRSDAACARASGDDCRALKKKRTDYQFDWPVGIDFILKAPFLSNKDKEAILRAENILAPAGPAC